MTENEISGKLINIFIRVHRTLGPGLLESVYEAAICYELKKAGIQYKRQLGIEALYGNVLLGELAFRADIVVEDKVIVEIKSVETLARVHPKILLTYLRMAGLKLGLLVNFNVCLLKDGITRIVNGL